jgi:heme peroxidase
MMEEASTREDFAAAERVLLHALSMDPVDTTGETHYLLGLACFHQEKWSDVKRFLKPSALNIQHPRAPALLERVETILATAVDRAVDPLPDFDPHALGRPAAGVLKPPQASAAPLPTRKRRSFLKRPLYPVYNRVAGLIANAAVVVAWWLRDRSVIFDFESWDRRSVIRGLLEIGGRRHDLATRLHSAHEGGLVGGQPPGQRRPQWTERFRSATGAWTTDDPMEGAAGAEIQRSGSPLAERKDRSADPDLPNPREVSRLLLAPHAARPRQEAPFLNLLTIAWIQAQLHDWVSHRPTPVVGAQKIELEPHDPLRERYGIGALHVQKSAANGMKALSYLNEVTHWWDASHIYGSDEQTLERLRAREDGKLKIKDDFLPQHPDTGIEDTGFARNWWIGLDLMHTLFVRHHNYICERLKEGEKERAWTSDELFHTARLVNAAIMAKIQTVEWTPAVLPNKKVALGMATNWWGLLQATWRRVRERKIHNRWEPRHHVLGGIAGGSRDNFGKPYGMTEEFTEVYRLHAGIPDEIRLKPLGDAPPPRPVPMDKTRGTGARGMVEKHGMAMLLNSFGHQHMPALVHNNYPAFMCEMTVPGQPVIDIGTIDIYRARERGVPPYNEFRRMLGLNPITRFEDLGCSAETVETLEGLYGAGPEGVEKLDLLAGTSCELWRPENFGFGETMFTVFIQMASRRLLADPFYTEKFNERYYTKTGMALIEKATLKSVLLQHYPELEQAGLCNVENAFEPWGTNARECPEEHPLAAIVNY